MIYCCSMSFPKRGSSMYASFTYSLQRTNWFFLSLLDVFVTIGCSVECKDLISTPHFTKRDWKALCVLSNVAYTIQTGTLSANDVTDSKNDQMLKLHLHFSTFYMYLTVPHICFVKYSRTDDFLLRFGSSALKILTTRESIFHTWRQHWRTTQITVVGSVAVGVCNFVMSVFGTGSRGRAREAVMHDWNVLWTTWRWNNFGWNTLTVYVTTTVHVC